MRGLKPRLEGKVECHNVAVRCDTFCQMGGENSRLGVGPGSRFSKACGFNTLADFPTSSLRPGMEAELPYLTVSVIFIRRILDLR